MQSKEIETRAKMSKFTRSKLQKHDTLHEIAVKTNRTFCSLTGFLHVLPDFYIIGVQKSGTSSLFDYLIQHPSVYPPVTKEINFFDKYYHRGLNWYKVCFPTKSYSYFVKNFLKRPFVTGEATERYIEYPHAPQRIKKTTPHAKLIVMLRNPVDRAYSHWNMLITSKKKKETLSFEQAIETEQNRLSTHYEKMLKDENYYDDSYFRFSYLKRGIYVDNLKRWMSVFPKEQFLILKSEDFFENPNKIYNQVLEFLKLPKFELKEYKIIAKINKNKNIEPHLRKKLEDYFRPHNERLYKFLGVNFNWE